MELLGGGGIFRGVSGSALGIGNKGAAVPMVFQPAVYFGADPLGGYR